MTVLHGHLAVSPDGPIARPDGGIDWLVEDDLPEGLGFEAFRDALGLILMGRGSHDVARAAGASPHADKRGMVLTARPLTDAPPGVTACAGLGPAVAQAEAEGIALVWVEGGGQLVRGMAGLGRPDVPEMAVIPRIPCAGIPPFPPGTADTLPRLEFVRERTKGAIHLRYRRA